MIELVSSNQRRKTWVSRAEMEEEGGVERGTTRVAEWSG